jgi:hypothetical protein
VILKLCDARYPVSTGALPSCGYEYSGLIETDCVATSLVAILLAINALRTSVAVVDDAASDSLELLVRIETAALIRTASGTTIVVPVALTLIYRVVVSTAIVGIARAVPPIREMAMVRAAIVRNDLVFMP